MEIQNDFGCHRPGRVVGDVEVRRQSGYKLAHDRTGDTIVGGKFAMLL